MKNCDGINGLVARETIADMREKINWEQLKRNISKKKSNVKPTDKCEFLEDAQVFDMLLPHNGILFTLVKTILVEGNTEDGDLHLPNGENTQGIYDAYHEVLGDVALRRARECEAGYASARRVDTRPRKGETSIIPKSRLG